MSLSRSGFALISAILASSSFAAETRFISFKAYEEIPIKTTNGETVILGQGQLSPRPTPRPTTDWRAIGKSFGMKENPRFCSSQDIDDDLARGHDLITVHDILLDARIARRRLLTAEESNKLKSVKLCQSLESVLVDLAQQIPNIEPAPSSTPVTPGGNMIVNMVLSDEGHGWLVLNNRLTQGQQAIIHTGTKVKQDRFADLTDLAVTKKTAQQPFALRKQIVGYSQKDLGESLYRYGTCHETVYRNECTYDPDTHQGHCERVPYSVEGSQRVTVKEQESTYLIDVELRSEDNARVLGVLTMETRSIDKDYNYSECVTEPIPDYNHDHWHP